MGKQSRTQRRDRTRQLSRYPESAAVAASAASAADLVEATSLESLKLLLGVDESKVVRIDHRVWDEVRDDLRSKGRTWPGTTYLPSGAVTASVYRALHANGGREQSDLDPLAAVASPLCAIVNWRPGQVAVRVHDELLRVLVDTPMEGTIPAAALLRLPAWGLYLDTPHLGPDAGVFAYIDPELDDSWPKGDGETPNELVLVFVLPEQSPPMLVSSIFIDNGSLAEALFDRLVQPDQIESAGDLLEQTEAESDAWFDSPFRQVIAGVVSLLLYLCVNEPDIIERRLPNPSRRTDGGDTPILEVGWRLGAQLAASRTAGEPTGDQTNPAGRGVAPHLRRAHWHSYWTGPRAGPDARQLVLRWVAPTLVAAHDTDVPTTVRSVPRDD